MEGSRTSTTQGRKCGRAAVEKREQGQTLRNLAEDRVPTAGDDRNVMRPNLGINDRKFENVENA
jgi:hypothetical protein